MNLFRMIKGRIYKSTASHEGTEIVVCDMWLYKISEMFGANASKNKKHMFYKGTVQAIIHLEKRRML